MNQLLGSSMMCRDKYKCREAQGYARAATYRIAVGPQAGRKAFSL